MCACFRACVSNLLYTANFYKFLHSKLNPGGLFVTQSGPGSAFNADECFSVIHHTMEQCFDHVVSYTTDIPSFGEARRLAAVFLLPRVPGLRVFGCVCVCMGMLVCACVSLRVFIVRACVC